MSLLTAPTGRNVDILTDRIVLFTSHTDYSESGEGCEGNEGSRR
jgi:hypothetical protein